MRCGKEGAVWCYFCSSLDNMSLRKAPGWTGRQQLLAHLGQAVDCQSATNDAS